MQIPMSIHPRRWLFGAAGKKLNTCEPRKLRSTVQRAYDGVARHLMDHPNDAMATARANKLEKILSEGNLR